MSRPLRLEFVGALYHVTSRGDRREPIVGNDSDRQAWLAVLEQGLERFEQSMIARAADLSVSRVSRLVAAYEAHAMKDKM